MARFLRGGPRLQCSGAARGVSQKRSERTPVSRCGCARERRVLGQANAVCWAGQTPCAGPGERRVRSTAAFLHTRSTPRSLASCLRLCWKRSKRSRSRLPRRRPRPYSLALSPPPSSSLCLFLLLPSLLSLSFPLDVRLSAAAVAAITARCRIVVVVVLRKVFHLPSAKRERERENERENERESVEERWGERGAV